MTVKSTIVKRSIVLGGTKTSVSLEDEFWKGLQALADRKGLSVSKLVERINAGRRDNNLSSTIRVFVYTAACEAGGAATPATEHANGVPHAGKAPLVN